MERNPKRDEFTLVEGRKSRKNKLRTNAKINTRKNIYNFIGNSIDSRFASKLHGDKELIKTSKLLSDLVSKLEVQCVKCIISYGIGNFGSSRIARLQYALFLCLKQAVLPEQCAIYDPVLSKEEIAIALNDGVSVIEVNEECRRSVTTKTLFYMPHCDRPMYDNVLWANWDPDIIDKVLILGNSFASIRERVPNMILKSETPILCKVIIHGLFSEDSLDVDSSIDDDIFNDCAFVWFDANSLRISAPEVLSKPEICKPCTPIELSVDQHKPFE